jgi:hypothetical protein
MENSEENAEKPSTWQSTKAVWKIIIWMVVVGAVSIIAMSIQFVEETKHASLLDTLQVIGAALLVAGASFSSGGLAGFLFGIPKILQNETLSKDQNSTNKISIVQNDNLVEISDWLTKIIVGVGLTQLYKIPDFLGKIGRDFSPIFGNDAASKAAVISILLYFLAVGFFAVYLWTRLFFVRSLKTLNDQLQKEIQEAHVQIQDAQVQIKQAQTDLEDLKKQKDNL